MIEHAFFKGFLDELESSLLAFEAHTGTWPDGDPRTLRLVRQYHIENLTGDPRKEWAWGHEWYGGRR
jgi:hypothetical protein